MGIHNRASERAGRTQEPTCRTSHDVLAGLLDPACFVDKLTSEIAYADVSGQRVIVALLNLDGFRETTNVLGRKVEDQLLQDVANRLRSRLRNSDTVARSHGDEFLLLLPRITRKEDVERVAQRILEIFQQPFLLGDLKFRVTTSLGLAVYPDHGRDVERLIGNAILAMYRVTQHGRNNYQFFNCTVDPA